MVRFWPQVRKHRVPDCCLFFWLRPGLLSEGLKKRPLLPASARRHHSQLVSRSPRGPPPPLHGFCSAAMLKANLPTDSQNGSLGPPRHHIWLQILAEVDACRCLKELKKWARREYCKKSEISNRYIIYYVLSTYTLTRDIVFVPLRSAFLASCASLVRKSYNFLLSQPSVP